MKIAKSLEVRVGAQMVGTVAILIPRGDQHQAEANDVRQTVPIPFRFSRILQTVGQAVR